MKSSVLKKKKPPGLMLTSLLDMFTIILIFLIVSFEAEDQDFKLNPGLKLPESSARSIFKPAVSLAITPTSVVAENKPIVELQNGQAPDAWHQEGGIPDLIEFLKKRYEQLEVRAEREEKPIDEVAIIVVQADKNLDYKTLYLVLRSASQAGFHKYRLAIMKK